MRGLAEFVMRGRMQALAVAVVGTVSPLFVWISGAAIALVTLRQGAISGGWLLFWALLPASVLAVQSGDAGGVLLLAGAFGMALLLRESVSLPLALLATLPIGLAGGLFLMLATSGFLEQLVEWYSEFLRALVARLEESGGGSIPLRPLTVPQVAGLLAAGNATLCTASLLMARYWQALLYNPGGFGDEFRSLRLPKGFTLALAMTTAGLWVAGPDFSGWALIFAVPLTFCGFSLAHARVKAKGLGTGWLTAFYVLWLVIDPVKAVLLGLVVADAFTDFRAQWRTDATS